MENTKKLNYDGVKDEVVGLIKLHNHLSSRDLKLYVFGWLGALLNNGVILGKVYSDVFDKVEDLVNEYHEGEE